MPRSKAPPKGKVKVTCAGCGKPAEIPARDYWAEAEYAEKFKEKPRPWFHQSLKCFDMVRTKSTRGGSRRGAGRKAAEQAAV